METPQVESANTLTIDFQDSPDLRELLGKKQIGDKCRLTLELQVMSRYPEGMQLAIEKVITEGYEADGGKTEAEASDKEPIMATIRNRQRKHRGMEGPRTNGDIKGGPQSRPPQTAVNSAEPWLTSYT